MLEICKCIILLSSGMSQIAVYNQHVHIWGKRIAHFFVFICIDKTYVHFSATRSLKTYLKYIGLEVIVYAHDI